MRTLSLILLLSPAAHADFLLPSNPTVGPAAKTLPAAVFLEWPNGTCSGAFVSDQGHILTAAHCLAPCVQPGSHAPQTCTLNIDGAPARVRVELMSVCDPEKLLTVEELKAGGKEIPAELESCLTEGDLAVLLPLDPLPSFGCLPLNFNRPALGENVFAVGVPRRTYRTTQWEPQSVQADTKTVLFSLGQVVKQNTCTSLERAKGLPGPSLLEHSVTHARVDAHYLQTTVDIVRGSSGSPLVNQNGEVVGVASHVESKVQNRDHECRGATFFEPLAEMANNLKGWGGSFSLNELRCEKKRALTH